MKDYLKRLYKILVMPDVLVWGITVTYGLGAFVLLREAYAYALPQFVAVAVSGMLFGAVMLTVERLLWAKKFSSEKILPITYWIFVALICLVVPGVNWFFRNEIYMALMNLFASSFSLMLGLYIVVLEIKIPKRFGWKELF